MVITINMKNVVPRGTTYYFRMSVPADCREAIGQCEIYQSLHTSDELEAGTKAQKLRKKWKTRFKEVRQVDKDALQTTPNRSDGEVAKFLNKLTDHLSKALPDYLDTHSREDLIEFSRFCAEVSIEAEKCGDTAFDLEALLGVSYPPPDQKTHGKTRQMRKVFVGVMADIRKAIDKELGEKVSKLIDKKIDEPIPGTEPVSSKPKTTPAQTGIQTGILAIANELIETKNIEGFFKSLILTEIANIQEWSGKSNLTDYTKADVVDYVRNCLPYIPKRRNQKGGDYKGKSLAECVKMTKGNPDKYVPISHRTCDNRFTGLTMVFNYAKEDLGLLTINLAKNVVIPKVRSLEKKPRAFTKQEVIDMWAKLKEVNGKDKKYPERYWVTVLGLFHGARQNELCSLRLKDVYEHEDGTYVMDIDESEADKKSVKTKSSIRIVPIHPYVRDTLGFKAFVDERKAKGKANAQLFPNLTFDGIGYGRKVSRWFNKWKTEWLEGDSRHKNFHGLRYTFIQQAQNQAKMSDRCTQEITGHSVTSVSAIHQGYSGRLQPKAVLEELAKIEFTLEAVEE